LTWDIRLSAAFNRTRVEKLMEGLDKMIYYSADGNAVQIVAEKGRPLGDIYVHPRETDANGNFIIDGGGYYTMSQDYVKVGNILPKSIGGLANTFTYKGVALNVLLDYRFGGKLVSPPTHYGKGAGLYKETLQYRDESNGGLPYYISGDQKILLESHSASAPDNSKVYHDGILLNGVTSDGSKNTTILDAPSYYLTTYDWSTGWYEDGAVFDNSYIKVREVTLSYSIPKNISSRLKLQNVQVSLIGRNLFYVWKTLPHLDPEVAIGSAWNRQGVDEGSMAPSRSYGFSINAKF
jgi:iron complex outermembrane recepter protein